MKRGILSFSLVLLLLSLFSCEQEEPIYVRYAANKNGVKVYQYANSEAKVLYTIPYGTRIEVLGDPSKKEWVKVELHKNGKEIEGFVKTEELSAIEPKEEVTNNNQKIDTTNVDTTKMETITKEEKPTTKKETEKNKEITQETKNKVKTKPITATTKTKPTKKEEKNVTPNPEPKTKKSRLAAEASLISSSLLTYNKGLKDAEVNTANIYTWAAPISKYKGVYEGPLASNISKLELNPSGNSLKGTIYFSVEEVSPTTGMIESKETQATITIDPTTGKVSISSPNLKITSAEFVRWNNYYGIILKVTSPTTTYVLLEKTK